MRQFVLGTLLLSVVSTQPLTAAEPVFKVTQEKAEAYHVDDKISGDQPLKLQEGETLELRNLGNDKVCVYFGPNHNKPVCPLVISGIERKDPRPVRSIADAPQPPAWAVDISKSYDFCYRSLEEVTLWRPEVNYADTLVITNRNTQQEARLSWPSQENTLAWPQDKLPLLPDTAYLLKTNRRFRILTVHEIPADLKTPADRLEWMSQQQCRLQVEQESLQSSSATAAPR